MHCCSSVLSRTGFFWYDFLLQIRKEMQMTVCETHAKPGFSQACSLCRHIAETLYVPMPSVPLGILELERLYRSENVHMQYKHSLIATR